jgi:hypothetical protein
MMKSAEEAGSYTEMAFGLPSQLLTPDAIKQAAGTLPGLALRPSSRPGSGEIACCKPTSLMSHVLGSPSRIEGSHSPQRNSGSLPAISLSMLGRKESRKESKEEPLSPREASPPIKAEKSAKDLICPDSLFGGEGVMRSASSWTQGGILKRPTTASSNGMLVSDAKVMEEARKRLETIETTNQNLRRLAGSNPESPLGGGSKTFRSRFLQSKAEEREKDRTAAFDMYSHTREEASGLIQRDFYSGSFGSRKDLLMKLEAENKSVMRKNPEAFQPDAAALTDLARIIAVEEAREKLEEANTQTTHPEKAVEFKEALLGISVSRPFFIPPTKERRQARDKVEREVPPTGTSAEKVWQTTLDNRAGETESGSMFDTEEVRLLQFDLDWIRVSQKARFRRAVTLEDKDGPKVSKESREVYSDELFEVYKVDLMSCAFTCLS